MLAFQKLVKRLLALIMVLFLLMITVFFGVIYYDRSEPSQNDILEPLPKEIIVEFDADKFVLNNSLVDKQVVDGYLLLSASSEYMGPLNEDPNLRFSGNNLSCTNSAQPQYRLLMQKLIRIVSIFCQRNLFQQRKKPMKRT